MVQYNSRISSFENDRLNIILKRFYDKKLNVASYDEYNKTIRDEKKNRDIQTILSQTKIDLKSLFDTLKKEIKSLVDELGALIYPNISKAISLSGEKTFGAIEFQNALEIYKAKPNNIHKILKLAIEHQRFDFVFFTLDFYMKDSDLPASEKMKMQTIYDELSAQTGFAEKQKNKNQLESDLVEVEDYLNLINESPDRFEAKILTTVKVAKKMKETGQLEGETILLSK